MFELESAWPHPVTIPTDVVYRIVQPLKSKLLPGYSPHEDVDIEELLRRRAEERKEKNLAQAVKYRVKLSRTSAATATRISVSSARREKIVEWLRTQAGWRTSNEIVIGVDERPQMIWSDMTELRGRRLVDYEERLRDGSSSIYYVYRAIK